MDAEAEDWYPYGLNNWQGHEYKKVDTHVLVGKKILSLPIKHNGVFGGSINR